LGADARIELVTPYPRAAVRQRAVSITIRRLAQLLRRHLYAGKKPHPRKKLVIASGAGEIAHPRCNLTEYDYLLPNRRARAAKAGRLSAGRRFGAGRGETTVQLEVK